jgi:enoyl-CoA hydratase/carnithine racemase
MTELRGNHAVLRVSPNLGPLGVSSTGVVTLNRPDALNAMKPNVAQDDLAYHFGSVLSDL